MMRQHLLEIRCYDCGAILGVADFAKPSFVDNVDLMVHRHEKKGHVMP